VPDDLPDSGGLLELRIEHFRCLESVHYQADPHLNLIVGPNASGKTSFLEAIYFLGRGRSFRSPQTQALIQTGRSDFTVFGRLHGAGPAQRVGVSGRRQGIEIHIDGRPGGTRADLARCVPVQVIDAEVHELIQGGPETRRRFLDWGVFHVKHAFLPVWRRYRRALQQRNAALRRNDAAGAVSAWDPELVEFGEQVHRERLAYFEQLAAEFKQTADKLLGSVVNCRYLSGWGEDRSLTEALAGSADRDRALGATQVGPHRAELKIDVESLAARHRVSRGQQKLMGAALVIAQSRLVASTIGERVVLLVDEPRAELDQARLGLLMTALQQAPVQLFLTTLEPDGLPLTGGGRVFHVEHGEAGSLL